MKISINPYDQYDISQKLRQARKDSGLNNTQIIKFLTDKYGEELSDSALSYSIWRGTIRFRRALMILSVCGVTEIEIEAASNT